MRLLFLILWPGMYEWTKLWWQHIHYNNLAASFLPSEIVESHFENHNRYLKMAWQTQVAAATAEERASCELQPSIWLLHIVHRDSLYLYSFACPSIHSLQLWAKLIVTRKLPIARLNSSMPKGWISCVICKERAAIIILYACTMLLLIVIWYGKQASIPPWKSRKGRPLPNSY